MGRNTPLKQETYRHANITNYYPFPSRRWRCSLGRFSVDSGGRMIIFLLAMGAVLLAANAFALYLRG